MSQWRCIANQKIRFTVFPFDYTAPTLFLGTIHSLVGLDIPGSIETLTKTIKVKGGADASQLNMYIEIKDPSPQQWHTLKQAVSKVRYNTNFTDMASTDRDGHAYNAEEQTTPQAYALWSPTS